MSAQHEIAKLDRQLAAKGEPVVFKRVVFETGTEQDVPTRAFIRGATPEEIAAGIDVHTSRIVLSPTGLSGFIPKEGDQLLVAGSPRSVTVAETRRIGEHIVRFDLQAAG
ncbi:hypothetical protein [Jiella avicenniae]|uniref:Uncharacterized protein n=1 Tax=Jiella avicenniae TaxID=2907202 RepID=A0A9X1T5H7_9HYPH|nr:hypothetical protein [Jiella avicenniae]MCE7028929.1 hypothetical protein [Jiella avicenniae]